MLAFSANKLVRLSVPGAGNLRRGGSTRPDAEMTYYRLPELRFLAATLFVLGVVVPSNARTQDVPNSSGTLVTIHLTSDPIGADINIDNTDVGLTPMAVKVKPGKHAIRMFMTDYQNWVQWTTILAGPDVDVKATLTMTTPDSARRPVSSAGAITRIPSLVNVDILEMLKAGLSQEIVIAKIKASACEFDTSPATLKALKTASVPDEVILAMIQAPSIKLPRQGEEKRAESTQKGDDDLVDCKVQAQNEYDTKMNVIATMPLAPVTRVAASSRLKQNLDAEVRECRSQYELATRSNSVSHP